MLRLALRHRSSRHSKLQATFFLRTYAHHTSRTIGLADSKTRHRRPVNADPAFSNIPSWPIDVLRVACQSGAIKVSLPKVYEFLDGIWSLASIGRLNKSNVEALLSKYALDAQDLTIVARCLPTQRSDRRLASLGLDCLSLAADIGDEAAALYLVDLVVENRAEKSIGTLRYQKALSRVKDLAASKDLISMVLVAKVYVDSNNIRAALNLYQEVVDLEMSQVQQGLPILEKDRSSYAEANRNLGRLLSRAPGTQDAAMQCFERAATEYEDAQSFFYLALERGESHKDYIKYMLQAAISGVTDASYKLGLAYAKEGDTAGFAGKQGDTSYSMALHWFKLAEESADEVLGAKLHIARIRRLQEDPGKHNLSELNNVTKELEDLPPLLRSFLDTHWDNPVFSLDAATLESKIEKWC